MKKLIPILLALGACSSEPPALETNPALTRSQDLSEYSAIQRDEQNKTQKLTLLSTAPIYTDITEIKKEKFWAENAPTAVEKYLFEAAPVFNLKRPGTCRVHMTVDCDEDERK